MTVAGPRATGPLGRGPRANNPRRGVRRRSSGAANPVVGTAATAWFDGHDGSGLQQIPSRIGAAVTTLGSTTGVDTNDPTWGSNGWTFDATDDYMSSTATIPAINATTGKHTAMVALIMPVASGGTFWGTGSIITKYFMLYRNASNIAAYARGTTTAAQAQLAATFTAGTATVFGFVVDTGNIYVYKYQAGVGTLSAPTSITGVGTIDSLTNPRYGNIPHGTTSPMGGKLYAAVEWANLALDQTALDAVAAYLLGTF